MLFDDPVDNSGQLVSELNIPAPADQESTAAGKLPANADQVLKSSDPEPLSAETPSDSIESTGAAEEVIEEPEAAASKQGRAGESLYAESEGYASEDANVEEAADQPLDEPAVKLPKPRPKQTPPVQSSSDDAATGARKIVVPKAPVRDIPVESAANDSVKIKKAVESAKPAAAKDSGTVGIAKEPVRAATVKKLDSEPPVAAVVPKQPTTAKSLAAAVAEAKKPVVEPKTNPKLVRWYIQLGSFSKKENAMSLWESLREQGLAASLDTVQTDKGISYRLKVGPELDGKKAAAMKQRLDKQNIKAILISE
jgi:DedD protein